MTRLQWLWLFIWIFIFFTLFCLWSKVPTFASIKQTQTPSHTVTQVIQQAPYLKALKQGKEVTLSGIVPDQATKALVVDAFSKNFEIVKSDALQIEDHVQKSDIPAFFANVAETFSHFNSGLISYHDKELEVDGDANYTIVAKDLNETLFTLSDITIKNRLSIVQEEDKVTTAKTPLLTKQKVEENSTNITPPSLQERLDTLLQNQRVHFRYATNILTSDSKVVINKIIKLLKSYPTATIEIAGHTDSDGTKKTNLALSKKRANYVKRYMHTHGIKNERLIAVGYGESQPLVANTTQANKRKNRRVEFKVIGEKND